MNGKKQQRLEIKDIFLFLFVIYDGLIGRSFSLKEVNHTSGSMPRISRIFRFNSLLLKSISFSDILLHFTFNIHSKLDVKVAKLQGSRLINSRANN
jgi:hypothetical protein